MSTSAYHLYVISFTVGSEAGLAMVAAGDERTAFQILKSSGNRRCESYTLVQIRDIGMTASCSYGLLLESFVNAREAYDAVVNSVKQLVAGPAGPPGVTDVEVFVSNTTGNPHASASVENEKLTIHLSGIKGERGEKGDKGDQGIQGIPGETGAVGPRGLQGEKGDKGDRGEQGIQGIPGESGEDGVGLDTVTTEENGIVDMHLSNGDIVSLDLRHTHPQYLKYMFVDSDDAYDNLHDKSSDTLYLIPVEDD